MSIIRQSIRYATSVVYDPRALICVQWINMLSKVCSQCSIIVQVASSLWLQPCLPIYKMSGESIKTQKSG